MLSGFELQSHVSTSCQACGAFISPVEIMIAILGRFEPGDIAAMSQAAKNLYEDTIREQMWDEDLGGVFIE